MRIVAGKLKNMTLSSTVSESTRPTSDKVREAIFSMLFSRMDIEGVFVADLYAGTGALGLEAFSRGASHVTFIETNKKACIVIDANIAEAKKRTDADSETFTTLRMPVLTFAKGERKHGEYDLVFADPPYDDDIEVDVLTIIASGGYLVYETSAANLELCEKTFREHVLVKDIAVSRVIGASGVLIVQVV